MITSLHVAKSDSRLIFDIAGYVAQKFVWKTKCESCMAILTTQASDDTSQLAMYTVHCDNGGIISPSAQLHGFVSRGPFHRMFQPEPTPFRKHP